MPTAAGRVPEGSALRRCLNPAGDRGGAATPRCLPREGAGEAGPRRGDPFSFLAAQACFRARRVRLRARLGEPNLLSFNHPVASAHRAHPTRAGYLMEHVEAGSR